MTCETLLNPFTKAWSKPKSWCSPSSRKSSWNPRRCFKMKFWIHKVKSLRMWMSAPVALRMSISIMYRTSPATCNNHQILLSEYRARTVARKSSKPSNRQRQEVHPATHHSCPEVYSPMWIHQSLLKEMTKTCRASWYIQFLKTKKESNLGLWIWRMEVQIS